MEIRTRNLPNKNAYSCLFPVPSELYVRRIVTLLMSDYKVTLVHEQLR